MMGTWGKNVRIKIEQGQASGRADYQEEKETQYTTIAVGNMGRAPARRRLGISSWHAHFLTLLMLEMKQLVSASYSLQ